MKLARFVFGILMLLVFGFGSAANGETITLLTHWAASTQLAILREKAAEYTALHPDIKVDVIGTGGGNAGMEEKLKIMLAANTPPNAVHTGSPELYTYAPMPQKSIDIMKKIFLPAAVTLSMVNGQCVGYPTEFQYQGVLYNTDILANAGIGTAPTPATWESFFGLAKKLTRFNSDNKVTLYGYVGGGTQDVKVLRSYLVSNGSDVVTKDGIPALNAHPMVKAVSLWKELFDNKTYSRGQLAAFARQEAALAIWEPFARTTLMNTNAKAYNDGVWKVSPLPHGSLGKPYAYTYGYVWAIPKMVKDPATTQEFLDWLNADITDKGTTRMGDVMAPISLPRTYADLNNQPMSREPILRQYIDVLPGYNHMSWMPSNAPGSDQYMTPLSTQLNNIFSGKVTVIQGLEEAQLQYKQNLEAAAKLAASKGH